MNWQWLLEPLKPNWLFSALIAAGIFASLTLRPEWGIFVAVLIGIVFGLVAGVVIKLVQEKTK